MTKPRVPSATVPPALAVARRALVLAALALLVGAGAVLIAVLGDSDSEPIDTAPLEEAQTAAETARTEARQAAADAVNAATRAETAAQSSAAADPDDSSAVVAESQAVADLQAQLEELRAEVALARAEARAAADAGEEAAAGEVTDDEAPTDIEQPPTADGDDPPAAEEEPSGEGSVDPGEDPPAPEPDDDVTLPGEASDIGPASGAGLVVVGIASNSALNVRDVPIGDVIARLDNELGAASDPGIYVRGPNSDDIIATVDLSSGLIATGRTRMLSTSFWHEFTAGTVTGWSSATFLAQVGATDDITAQIVETMGEVPTAGTLADLGRAVAQTMAAISLRRVWWCHRRRSCATGWVKSRSTWWGWATIRSAVPDSTSSQSPRTGTQARSPCAPSRAPPSATATGHQTNPASAASPEPTSTGWVSSRR